jgi:hypothetical protein
VDEIVSLDYRGKRRQQAGGAATKDRQQKTRRTRVTTGFDVCSPPQREANAIYC